MPRKNGMLEKRYMQILVNVGRKEIKHRIKLIDERSSNECQSQERNPLYIPPSYYSIAQNERPPFLREKEKDREQADEWMKFISIYREKIKKEKHKNKTLHSTQPSMSISPERQLLPEQLKFF